MMHTPARRSSLALLTLSVFMPAHAAPALPAQPGPDIHYSGAAFDEVAQTSYRTVGLPGLFTDWLDAAYLKSGMMLGQGGSLEADLDARAAQLAAAAPAARVQLERDTAAWAHRLIKKVIPKFSLDRGFELANVVKTGERQCLAQSFILSALLQRAGLRAGAVMVWSNPKGGLSNLGHVVSTVRLSSGHDLLVDASDPTPFIRHQGLLVRVGQGYAFVKPTYQPDDSISGYTAAGGGRALSVDDAAPLTLSYLHSQFDYYRGERAVSGLFGTGTGKTTPAGLQQSAVYLNRALQEDGQNALARFMLGHVLEAQGQTKAAKAAYLKARVLYVAQGHIPGGVNEAVAAVGKPVKAGKS